MADTAGVVPPERITIPPLSAERGEVKALEEFRAIVLKEVDLNESMDSEEQALWKKDKTLIRYLRARKFDVTQATNMVKATMAWRSKVKPHLIEPEEIKIQTLTGKAFVPGRDVHGRGLLVLENDKDDGSEPMEAQMRHLSFNLERATRLLPPDVDRFAVFIRLDSFKLSTMPPARVTLETINIVCNHYPERLGVCIFYQAPYVFSAVWNLACTVIDAVTKSKVVFVSGDVSDGSANDKLLRDVVGPKWKELTGVCNNGNGFDPDQYWKIVVQDDAAWKAQKKGENPQEPFVNQKKDLPTDVTLQKVGENLEEAVVTENESPQASNHKDSL